MFDWQLEKTLRTKYFASRQIDECEHGLMLQWQQHCSQLPSLVHFMRHTCRWSINEQQDVERWQKGHYSLTLLWGCFLVEPTFTRVCTVHSYLHGVNHTHQHSRLTTFTFYVMCNKHNNNNNKSYDTNPGSVFLLVVISSGIICTTECPAVTLRLPCLPFPIQFSDIYSACAWRFLF